MISKESNTGRYPARGLYREVAAFDVFYTGSVSAQNTITYHYATPGVLPGDLVLMMFKQSLGVATTPSSDLLTYKFTVLTPGVVTIYAQNPDTTGTNPNTSAYRITVLRKE